MSGMRFVSEDEERDRAHFLRLALLMSFAAGFTVGAAFFWWAI